MLNWFRRRVSVFPILTAAVLASGATAACLFGLRPLAGRASAGTAAPAQVGEKKLDVVCVGYADVEHGVATLDPATPGRVLRVLAKEGERVQSGTILVQLDDRAARLRVRQAEVDLKAARERNRECRTLPRQHQLKVQEQQAAVAAAGQRLERARLLLSRRREQLQKELVNPAEVQGAEAAVAELEAARSAEQNKLRELQLIDPQAEVERAADEVEAKEVQLELARNALEDCRLRAPEDGTVLRVLVAPGDMLGPQSRRPAVLFCPAGERIVRAEVEQEFAGRVAEGQRAVIQDDARAGRVWHGRVRHVSDWFTRRRSIIPEPMQYNDVRTLECIISLDPGQPAPRIGQRLRVRIGGPAT
jgi:multidrug resistance efflux pump